MFVSTSQRTKGLQLITDLTSRLNTLEWLPILLIRLIEGIVFVDSGRHKLFLDGASRSLILYGRERRISGGLRSDNAALRLHGFGWFCRPLRVPLCETRGTH